MILLLWILLALFALRVAGQAMVAVFSVPWPPPMERRHSGVLPYGILLAFQIAIIVLMAKICFHWVLAAFVIAVGLWHRRAMRASVRLPVRL